jgi:hypothetical protein
MGTKIKVRFVNINAVPMQREKPVFKISSAGLLKVRDL